MAQTVLISALTTETITAAVKQALQVLERGGLVAFPTDTVYGLAASAFDTHGIDRLFQAKERQIEKAIPILLASPADLEQVTLDMPAHARILAQRFWPGPLTLVVPRHPALPENISPSSTIGVRMPDHPVALAILRASGPLAVTSANLSGFPSSTNASQVFNQLDGRVDLIIDGGNTSGGIPSTVVDCTGPAPKVLREGPLSKTDLDQALQV
ncbi:MAG TPA: L-threonylcarbamoyladenylate synthase [Anaerolineales bacterium]|nr:L-threonylcarbamoyladenylate synthase [Anaerolineales bacterium]